MDHSPLSPAATSSGGSSSKVKVEYTDPSGVYPLIASDLQSRLPLRTLNWNSPSRPVRSIESLYVELVPDEKNSSQPQKRAASSAGLPGQDTSSTSVVSDGRRGSESQAPKRERRHQIPGLRQTPYLKIYLLRCDDPDSYKAVARKAVREWIKAQAISQSNASTSNQENHDAFEWLIIHVVLPDPQGNSIWPTKLSATVLDKLRSDFNSSSKSSNDRVVQIPATKNLQVQGVTVSGTPSGPAREPFLQESGRAWDDLVAKFKSLILASFDSRVRQYEEDIKEKGSQRSLPGWNFCTFFVLKEGLARGFESVGLVDDALMGYDELSFELLAALRDQINKAAAGEDAGLFRDHTEDLRFQAEEALATTDASAENPGKYHLSTSVLDTERKPYRELILASNISAFDFRSYVFARQVSILSRIASLSAGSNPPPLKVSTNSNASGTVDPLVLTEICQRAVNFIASIGRTLRKDLQSAIPVDAEATESERAARFNVIENIISSWTYTSAQQILARTTEPSLSHEVDTFPVLGSHPNSPLSPSSGSRYSGQTPLPPRSSSLFGRIAPGSPSQQIDNASDDGRALKSPPPNPLSAGALQLAAQRGQLNLVARNALGAIGARRGWANGWKVIAHQETQEEMDDISLDGDLSIRETKKEKRPQNNMNDALPGVFDNSLRSALSSEENFYSAYEALSLAAFKLFQLSDEEKSAKGLIGDVAIIRYHIGDFSTAASYFHQLAPFYSHSDWRNVESTILDIYSRCLKKLDRVEDYVHITLKTLAKGLVTGSYTSGPRFNLGVLDVRGYLKDIIIASKSLTEPVIVPLKSYFSNVHVSSFLEHFDDRDGFKLALSIRSRMPDVLEVHSVKIRLDSIQDGQAREIWCSTDDTARIDRNETTFYVASKMLVPGHYSIRKVVLQAENVAFQHEYDFQSGNSLTSSVDDTIPEPLDNEAPKVILWPSRRSLEVEAFWCREIHLENLKAIVFEINSGENEVSGGKLLVKAGSAGLRLHTADAVAIANDRSFAIKSQQGMVSFGHLSPSSTLQIKIPYQLDTDMKEISIRSEVVYSTHTGEYTCGSSHHLAVVLPLGVNVQDIFKEHALFSKFSISSSTQIPLRILECELEGTPDFAATTPFMDKSGLYVFSKQPASLVYQIRRRLTHQAGKAPQTKLLLHVKYQCLNEEIVALLQSRLTEALDESSYAGYANLLVPHLLSTLIEKLPHQDLELIGLLREIGLPQYSDFKWDVTLSAIPPSERSDVSGWLQKWHKENHAVPLPLTFLKTITRRITIPVDVPTIQILYTAQLHILPTTQNPGVGTALPAELTISHTRAWAHSSPAPPTPAAPMPFHYDLDAPADTWLIGGKRRGFFSSGENEFLSFPILLLPQRAGHLILPSLDIKIADGQQQTETSAAAPSPQPLRTGDLSVPSSAILSPRPGTVSGSIVACEVDYRSQGVAVLVVPALTRVTVGVEMETPDRAQNGGSTGTWLIKGEGTELVA